MERACLEQIWTLDPSAHTYSFAPPGGGFPAASHNNCPLWPAVGGTFQQFLPKMSVDDASAPWRTAVKEIRTLQTVYFEVFTLAVE